ncbi:hypothetical protein R1sor_018269 [Riccia sorocarpa]|uniref:Ribonuclease H n=1 Tax=Riccia sorocarpa TaxID=122646 RepID=A0ABD3I9C3_9MARC
MTASARKYYAVKSGRKPGVYDNWDACEQQVKGFKGNNYKCFPTLEEAQQYVSSGGGRVPISVPVGKQFVSSGGGRVPISVPEIQKPTRDRQTLERSALSLSSAAIDARRMETSVASTTNPTTTGVYRIEYDGASKGNPGRAGAGALLRHPDGSVLCELTVGLGKTTNNVAEYRGLIAGLRKARELGIKRIQAQGDSKLVTMQLRDVWAVKNENLAVLCKEAKDLAGSFESFEIRHVDREWNSAADALANKGVGLPGYCITRPMVTQGNTFPFGWLSGV